MQNLLIEATVFCSISITADKTPQLHPQCDGKMNKESKTQLQT